MAKIRTVAVKDVLELDNFSAAFWADVHATKENYDRKFSDGEYKLLAMYVEKIVDIHEVGISSVLKSKIVSFLRYTFRKDYVQQFFNEEEEVKAKFALMSLYENLTFTSLDDFDFKKINENKDLNKGRGKVDRLVVKTGLNEEDIELALQYQKVMNVYLSGANVKFSDAERKQANIVMAKVLEAARDEAQKEANLLTKKLEMIKNLF